MIAYHSIGVALAVTVLISGPGLLAFAGDFLDTIIGVIDGGTIGVLHNQHS